MAYEQAADAPSGYEAIIIGAGFGGIRALYELQQMGLSVRLLEAGAAVGGTWHWNRYPGARTDSDAWAYCYSFSKELLKDWSWSAVRPRWDEVQAYLNHVVDRFELRQHIQANTRVTTARYDKITNRWMISTEGGQSFDCTYLISATGLLSIPYEPPFKGISQFRGQSYMSMRWPSESVDFAGKRVAIIGSGSTAVQILPLVAQTAAHTCLFQRTPNYVLPARNRPLEQLELLGIKKSYDKIWRQVRRHPFAFPMESVNRRYQAMTVEQIERVFDAAWEEGAFNFLFNSFDDIGANPQSNAAASEYVRNRIRAIVKDPATAELLCPRHPIGLKRPPVGTGYYETFNRSNVSVVDVGSSPIEAITPSGIATASDSYEFDIIVFAMGFDAATGALTRIEVRGAQGGTLNEKWLHGPQTNLGIMVDGFPNLFMVSGPHSPGGNIPPIIERTVEWIGAAINETCKRESHYIDATADSVVAWTRHIHELFSTTLYVSHSDGLHLFQTGSNIPGKARAPQFYLGGANKYADLLQDSISSGLPGFMLSRSL